MFRDVRIIRPAKDGFVPYRDYIGSLLEILDVATGRRQVVHSSAEPFEAPNWTPDGKALHLQHQRRRAKAAAASTASTSRRASRRSSTPASRSATTTTTCCRSTARCSASATRARTSGRRRSTRCPRRGGTPKRITPLTPSYLHGWSPDGKYARLHRRPERRVRHLQDRRRRQRRGDRADRRARGSTTARSTRPTAATSTSTPSAAGTMQIWRMKPDGRDPEQVTNDELQQLVPALLARRQARSRSSATARTSPRPTTRTTSRSTCG